MIPSAAIRHVLTLGGLAVFLFVAFGATAAEGDEHWDDQFGPAGADDILFSVATWGPNVCIGGFLTGAGNAKASYIAQWNGVRWTGMGGGVHGSTNFTYVFTVATDSAGNVYAGGVFTNAGGVPARNVAKWDGTRWSALGDGLGGYIYTLAFHQGDLYAGGLFGVSGSNTLHGLARWNGSNWIDVGGGITNRNGFSVVRTMVFNGNDLYIGGDFTEAGGVSATNLARWDGASWSPLGPGLNGSVSSLAFLGNDLYAGGGFTNAAGINSTNIARWDGNRWQPVGNGANRAVNALVAQGAVLYVGGIFNSVGGISANGVAVWDGSQWWALGAGLQGFGIGNSSVGASGIAVDGAGTVYAAGTFNVAGDVGASHLAHWDGARWSAVGADKGKGVTHFIGRVSELLVSGTNLYAGGIFTEAGDLIANRIARWDGTKWSLLGEGISGSPRSGVAPAVNALGGTDAELYVGGNFTNAGGLPANYIARWDGAGWSPLGSGVNSNINGVVIGPAGIYVGGNFTVAGDQPAQHIAKWDGFAWQPLGSGVNSNITSLALYGSDVLAGGSFTLAGGISASRIAKWNDATGWEPVGSGVAGAGNFVNVITVDGQDAYVGGKFTSVGGIAANNVARWDGTDWFSLGTDANNGVNNTVVAIAVRGTNVYVGGFFTSAGGVGANQVARWDGIQWTALGSGVYGRPSSPAVLALATMGNDLFLAGQFQFAGDKPAMFFARWNDQIDFTSASPLRLLSPQRLASGEFQFQINAAGSGVYRIEATSDFVSWQSLATNSTPDFTDSGASGFTHRFYRVRQQ
jgi:hypothetical protein